MVWALTDQKNLNMQKQWRVSQSSQTLSTFMMKTKIYNTSLQEIKLECLKTKDMRLLVWKNSGNIVLKKESTGSKSNFSLEYAATVTELTQRPHISMVKKDNLGTPSCSTALTTLHGNNSCCNCGKSFLQKANLMRRKEIGSYFKSSSACDEDPITNTVWIIQLLW